MEQDNTPTPQPGSNPEPVTGDLVSGDKVGGDKVMADKVARDKVTVVVSNAEEAGAVLSSLRWSWPKAWDFTTYCAEKREGFVGREWLFEEVRAWATDHQSEQALLISADYGVGKSAFLAQLIKTGAAGIPIAAEHFCTTEQAATLTAELFVRSLAAQFAEALPAYRRSLEADNAAELRGWLDEANLDPARAFEQAFLAPLAALNPAPEPHLLVVDALDEAQDPVMTPAPGTSPTIVMLLARYAKRLPPWLKLLATSRRHPDVLKDLRQSFTLKEIDAEEARNLADLRTYALVRCLQSPLREILLQADLTPEEVGEFLSTQQQSSGKFLYVEKVLNDLQAKILPLGSRADLEALPLGLDGFYADAFQRRFPREEGYALVEPILAVLTESKEPMGRKEIAVILECEEREISDRLRPLRDLLRLRPSPIERDGVNRQEMLHSFDHLSLQQWLTEVDVKELSPRAGRFSVNRQAAAERIRRWAMAEVTAKRAHIWPYLVRHLASHITAWARPGVIAGLLGEFAWLEARLRFSGINALLNDFALAAPSPGLGRLERALSQAAHVLGHENGWQGHEQLASQLLARISFETELSSLLTKAKKWLLNSGSAIPRTASLTCHDALIRTIQVGSPGTDVAALAVLADGRIASGSSENIIQLWNPSEGICTATLKGHTASITSLLVRNERFIVSGSCDGTIRIWDLLSDECIRSLDNLGSPITCLALVNNSCLASGSVDGSICLWDLNTFTRTDVVKRHLDRVTSLAVLNDGILASGSHDKSILLWRIVNDRFDDSLPRRFHEDEHLISCLAMLGDGGLISGSSKGTICVWNTLGHTSPKRLLGHNGDVMDLLPLNDNLLASVGDDRILLWNLDDERFISDAEGHLGTVHSARVLPNGQLVSCASDNTIRLWSLPCTNKSRIPDRHMGNILFLKAYTETVLVSLSVDTTVRYWDILACACISVVEDMQTHINLYTQFELFTGNDSSFSQSLFSANSIRAPWNGSCFRWARQGDWSEFPPLEIDVNRFVSIICMSVVCLAEKTNLNADARVIFVADALISSIIWLPHHRLLVLGDASGCMHWLEIAPLQHHDDSRLRHQQYC